MTHVRASLPWIINLITASVSSKKSINENDCWALDRLVEHEQWYPVSFGRCGISVDAKGYNLLCFPSPTEHGPLGKGPGFFQLCSEAKETWLHSHKKASTVLERLLLEKNQCSLLKVEGSSSQLCAQPFIRPSDNMHKHNGTFETEGGTHSKKERHKVFTLPQNSKKKDTNKPAQSSTRVTLPPCFYLQPVHGERRVLPCCDKGPPRNVVQFHQNWMKLSLFIKNHFHQKPLSSKTTFIRKPLSSKTNFKNLGPQTLNPKHLNPKHLNT